MSVLRNFKYFALIPPILFCMLSYIEITINQYILTPSLTIHSYMEQTVLLKYLTFASNWSLY